MRYALGIIIGFILSGIVFMGYAVIKLLGYGITDYAVLQSIWGLFLLWTIISVMILVVPLILTFAIQRSLFREFLLFEIGGLALFSPMWFLFASEITGTSVVEVLTTGVDNALPAAGPGGSVVGVDMGSTLLIPILVVMLIVGLIILRPSFILEHSISTPKKSKPKKTKADEEPVSIEEAMPDVSPPKADEESISELRSTLNELGVGGASIDALLGAGYSSVTEVIAASPEKLATALGIDRKSAEDLQLKVQKKAFFGGL
ncbi:MAG: conserved membrane protein of unknown function [Candidatus Thorarchaeota archaeon]|nr:MAG: conserved membrane protein of unknown function [Candidatus Thorarchaeota archaeon]